MMKQMMKTVLMTVGVLWLLAACRTTRTAERCTEHVENRSMTMVDSLTLQAADSVLVLVEKSDSMVRIVERTVKWRERVKVQRDTVRVYLSNDTIVKVESVTEKPSRSPPRWKLRLVILGLVTIVILWVAVKSKTIKHLLQL